MHECEKASLSKLKKKSCELVAFETWVESKRKAWLEKGATRILVHELAPQYLDTHTGTEGRVNRPRSCASRFTGPTDQLV